MNFRRKIISRVLTCLCLLGGTAGTGFAAWAASYSSPLKTNLFFSVAVDSAGDEWYGSNLGVVKRDKNTPIVTQWSSEWDEFTTKDGLANNAVYKIAMDTLGGQWFATTSGISHFNGRSWINFKQRDGLAGDIIQAIAIDSQNVKWFGTTKGLTRFDDTSWVSYSTSNGLSNNRVQAIEFDTAGVMWVGTRDGLCRRADTVWTQFDTSSGLPGNRIFSLAIDSINRVWVGTDRGVAHLEGDSFVKVGTPVVALSMAVDKRGRLWVGTTAGVRSVHDTNLVNWTNSAGFDSIGDTTVYGIAAGEGTRVFFASAKGIGRYDYAYNRYYHYKHTSPGTSVVVARPRPDGQVLSIASNNRGGHILFTGVQQIADARYYVFDARGRTLGRLAPAKGDQHTLIWDGTNPGGRRVAAGVYFLTILSGKDVVTYPFRLTR